MKNIFKDAYYGKPYTMKCGKTALFLRRKESDSNYYRLLIESDFSFKFIYVDSAGKHPYNKDLDITYEGEEETDLHNKYEELKDAYDALYMTYLSQVGLYKSLYEQEKAKNK